MNKTTKRIHMRDQVGKNKIHDIMCHYRRTYPESWLMGSLLIGLFLALTVRFPS